MKTYIKLLRDVKEDDKLGPQQKACMNAVTKATGGAGKQALRTDVIEALTKGGELVTRQDPARILSFYQPQFKEKGLIDIVKVADEKPAPAAKAPGKTAAAPSTPAKGTAPAAPASAAG
jgi:hypothetical protein